MSDATVTRILDMVTSVAGTVAGLGVSEAIPMPPWLKVTAMICMSISQSASKPGVPFFRKTTAPVSGFAP